MGAGGGNTASFAVELDGNVEDAAHNSAAALEQLQARIQADTQALRDLQQAMRQMQGASSVNVAAFKSLRDQIDAKKNALGQAQAKLVQMPGGLQRLASGARSAGGAMGGAAGDASRMDAAMRVLPESTRRIATRFGALKDAIGGWGIVAVAAVAVFALLGYAIVSITAKVTAFAIKSADARRSMQLLGSAAALASGATDSLESSVNHVAHDAKMSRDELTKLGLELERAGIGGSALEDSMRAIAIASSTLGDAAGGKLKALALKAKETGHFMAGALDFKGTGLSLDEVAGALASNLHTSLAAARAALADGRVTLEQGVAALNAAVTKKFGSIAKAQMLGLNEQLGRAKENLAGLFKGVHVEKFLGGLHSMLMLLDESTSSGRALQKIFSVLLNPIIDAMASPKAARFFKMMVIGALELTIALLKAVRAAERLIEKLGGLPKIGEGLGTGKGFGGVKPGGKAWDDLPTGGGKKLDGAPMGHSLTDGLAAGIMSGTSKVVAAVKALSGATEGAFTAHFEIHSPSGLMKRHGRQLPAGAADGVEEGAGELEKATANMLETPSAPRGRASAAGGQPGIGKIEVHIHGEGAARMVLEDQPRFVGMLAQALEQAVQMGGGKVAVKA